MSLKPVNIGLLGLGTVGSGVVKVLERNYSEIVRRTGRDLHVTQAAVNDLTKPRECSVDALTISNDPFAIVRDPAIDVVVELMGGERLARELVLEAIYQGKHVVTANKALIAQCGGEIFSAAQKQGVMVGFEAAVAGGIPIIKTLREGLSGNRIQQIAGIINGTSNFILTKMQDEGREFADVLQEAQALGYAEADPTFDIEGTDTAHKITILASIAFGVPLQFDQVTVEGISKITQADIVYAKELGYHIKHLGFAQCDGEQLQVRVYPAFVSTQHLLAHVNGAMNAVLVDGDAVGQTIYYGAGAGSEPTASAVMADLIDVVRVMTVDPENRIPHLAFQPDALTALPFQAISTIETPYYLRLHAHDHPGVMGEITQILGSFGISIEALLQKEQHGADAPVPIVITTHRVCEQAINDSLAKIEALPDVVGSVMRVRMADLL